MSDEPDPLPPLGGLASRALAAERARGDVDAGMHDRVLARVVASVAVGVALTGAAAAAHAATSTAAATGTATATGAATGTATAATATTAGLTAKTLPWIIAAFVVGGGVGAAVHAAVVPAASSSVASTATVGLPAPSFVSSSVPVATDVPPMPAVPASALPAAPSATSNAPAPITTGSAARVPAPATSPAAAGASDVDLAAERSLVDRARTALGRGQSGDALAALDAHATRYPNGRLSEEREALAVDALARSGRMDLARARATRFRATYPNSVFGAAVDAAIAPR